MLLFAPHRLVILCEQVRAAIVSTSIHKLGTIIRSSWSALAQHEDLQTSLDIVYGRIRTRAVSHDLCLSLTAQKILNCNGSRLLRVIHKN